MENQKMVRYLAQTRDRISAKGHGFLSFNKNMGKSNGKYRSKNMSGKYNQKLLDHIKQFTTVALFQKNNQKTAEATGDLIGNQIADRITNFSKALPQNSLEAVKIKHGKEILGKERYMYLYKKDRKLLMIWD